MIYLAARTKIWLRFDEMTREELEVCLLPGSRLRLRETPVLASQAVYLGDIIDTTLLADGSHRFERVLVPAPFNHYSWFISREVAASNQLNSFFEAVKSSGGAWEKIFGGVLHLHIPKGSAFDVEGEMSRVCEACS